MKIRKIWKETTTDRGMQITYSISDSLVTFHQNSDITLLNPTKLFQCCFEHLREKVFFGHSRSQEKGFSESGMASACDRRLLPPIDPPEPPTNTKSSMIYK